MTLEGYIFVINLYNLALSDEGVHPRLCEVKYTFSFPKRQSVEITAARIIVLNP